MILIADSGSTKTSWALLGEQVPYSVQITSGINPFHLDQAHIIALIKKEYPINDRVIRKICFYGAGCIPEKKYIVSEALNGCFGTEEIEIESDLLAAARALGQDEPGIISILGTGSNSCYYDGKKIVENVSPLGYILGDEGSGAVLGKRLVADLLKKQLPDALTEAFFAEYSLTPTQIMEAVYRQALPNRFLARFTPFLKKYIHEPAIRELVEDSLDSFVKRNLRQYAQVRELPLHFTGSIAWHFRENLSRVLEQHHLSLGKITQQPIEGLYEYHKRHLNR
ncbi:ATPase [Bacteroidales bacterium OttesenSCG-928-J19]|nr:ATPase [Bacteroidales bacterium OttesenSCG-928-J19]